MDEDGYPEEDELKLIKEWPWKDGRALFDFIKERWHWDNYMVIDGNAVSMSTGGWSGNEALIYALQENQMVQALYWVSSRRGGHYEYELRDWT